MSVMNTSLQTTPITNAARATARSAATSATSTSEFNVLNAQSFLQLLTAQLQNQDPTNPASETELASEMAGFSTATGVNTLNTNLQSMMQLQSAGSLASASALIGKQVAVPGDALQSGSNSAATGAFTLATPAANAVVSVTDANGNTVGTIRLANLGAGTQTFNWNAPAANTTYNFTVIAQDNNGATVTANPESLYTVAGVVQSASGLELSLTGNPNPVPISDVTQVQ